MAFLTALHRTSHALMNALILVVSSFGIQLAGLPTGAMATEQAFSRPELKPLCSS